MLDKQSYGPTEIKQLSTYMKSLGYKHQYHGYSKLTTINIPKGVRVTFDFQQDHSKLIAEIHIDRRTISQDDETNYLLVAKFSRNYRDKNLNFPLDTWHSHETKNLTWEQVITETNNLFRNVEGEPIPDKHELINNIILLNLKKLLDKAGYQTTLVKAKTEEYAKLTINHTNQFGALIIQLKSSKLKIGLEGEHDRTVKIPPYESPSFDPKSLTQATLFTLNQLREVHEHFITFNSHYSEAKHSIFRHFLDNMNPEN